MIASKTSRSTGYLRFHSECSENHFSPSISNRMHAQRGRMIHRSIVVTNSTIKPCKTALSTSFSPILLYLYLIISKSWAAYRTGKYTSKTSSYSSLPFFHCIFTENWHEICLKKIKRGYVFYFKVFLCTVYVWYLYGHNLLWYSLEIAAKIKNKDINSESNI